jgi:hypothetical protein
MTVGNNTDINLNKSRAPSIWEQGTNQESPEQRISWHLANQRKIQSWSRRTAAVRPGRRGTEGGVPVATQWFIGGGAGVCGPLSPAAAATFGIQT